MGTSDRFRGFVALPLSEAALDAALSAQADLKRRARTLRNPPRWTRPEQMHVTVKFLGQIERAAVSPLAEALDRACPVAPVEAHWGSVTAFGNPRRARVVVLAIDDPSARLRELATAVDEAAAALDVERETRPFQPHVTLGRLKPPSDVRPLLGSATPEGTAVVTFDRVVLVESELTPSGPRYTVLHEAHFGP